MSFPPVVIVSIDSVRLLMVQFVQVRPQDCEPNQNEVERDALVQPPRYDEDRDSGDEQWAAVVGLRAWLDADLHRSSPRASPRRQGGEERHCGPLKRGRRFSRANRKDCLKRTQRPRNPPISAHSPSGATLRWPCRSMGSADRLRGFDAVRLSRSALKAHGPRSICVRHDRRHRPPRPVVHAVKFCVPRCVQQILV
jgi:hypothetical protein